MKKYIHSWLQRRISKGSKFISESNTFHIKYKTIKMLSCKRYNLMPSRPAFCLSQVNEQKNIDLEEQIFLEIFFSLVGENIWSRISDAKMRYGWGISIIFIHSIVVIYLGKAEIFGIDFFLESKHFKNKIFENVYVIAWILSGWRGL